MLHTYALLFLLIALSFGCATNNSRPASSPTSQPASQPAAYEPPEAKTIMIFDAKCGVTEPSPIEDVAPQDQERVISPRVDSHRPFSRPEYPAYSLRNGQEGAPQVAALVTETGAIEQVKLVRTSGYVELDNAALESMRTWRLIPARIDGNPVCMWATFRIGFKLSTDSAP